MFEASSSIWARLATMYLSSSSMLRSTRRNSWSRTCGSTPDARPRRGLPSAAPWPSWGPSRESCPRRPASAPRPTELLGHQLLLQVASSINDCRFRDQRAARRRQQLQVILQTLRNGRVELFAQFVGFDKVLFRGRQVSLLAATVRRLEQLECLAHVRHRLGAIGRGSSIGSGSLPTGSGGASSLRPRPGLVLDADLSTCASCQLLVVYRLRYGIRGRAASHRAGRGNAALQRAAAIFSISVSGFTSNGPNATFSDLTLWAAVRPRQSPSSATIAAPDPSARPPIGAARLAVLLGVQQFHHLPIVADRIFHAYPACRRAVRS